MMGVRLCRFPSFSFLHSTLLILLLILFTALPACHALHDNDNTQKQQQKLQTAVPPFRMEVFVFTYNRLDSLQRLWRSLKNADYLGHEIGMTIFQDFNPNATDVSVWLDTQKWPHGKFIIHKRNERMGLRTNIEESWYPSDPDTFGAFFEDDIEVSAYWYVWASNAIQKYYYDSDERVKLAGFSLFRPNFNVLTAEEVNWDTRGKPFIFQQPQSWGQIMCPRPWRYFRTWLLQYTNPVIHQLDVTSNNWLSVKTWKKSLIRMMYDDGLYFIYPNFLNNASLSTHHMEKGVHFFNNDPTKLARNRVPLLRKAQLDEWAATMKYDPFSMPELERLQTFNLVGVRVSSWKDIYHGRSKLPMGYLFPYEWQTADFKWYDGRIRIRSNYRSIPITKYECRKSDGRCTMPMAMVLRSDRNSTTMRANN